MTEPVPAINVALSLMREALIVLDDPENAAVAVLLGHAIKLAEATPARSVGLIDGPEDGHDKGTEPL